MRQIGNDNTCGEYDIIEFPELYDFLSVLIESAIGPDADKSNIINGIKKLNDKLSLSEINRLVIKVETI
jgi:type III secretory pathway component EscU